MDLSRREKYIAIAALATVLILVLDQYAVTPVMDQLQEVAAEKAALVAQLSEAQSLFKRQRLHAARWRGMLESGMKRKPEEAESAIFHALREWSRQSGLSGSAVKPGKTDEQPDLVRLSFQVAAAGRMKTVAKFLWLIETATVPIRIEQLQLGARKDGEDDLSLQLKLSSICLPAPAIAKTSRKE